MATRDTFVTVADNDQLNDGYFNDHYYCTVIDQVYSGTSLNLTSTQAGAGTDKDNSSYEFSEIASSKLSSANYIEVNFIATSDGYCTTGSNEDASIYSTLWIQTKESGGSYGTSSATTYLHRFLIDSGADGGEDNESAILVNYRWLHTLSAGEKTNGVVVKLTTSTSAYASANSAEITLTLKQASLRVMK